MNSILNHTVGNQAMYNAGPNVASNIAFGSNTAQYSRGSFNSFLGASAGIEHKEGNHNILIGFAAASSDTTSNNQIVVGSNTTGIKDNSVVLGNSNTTDIYMSSDSGAVMHASNAKIHDLQLVPDRDSIVVWMPDSTFAVREASDLVEDLNQIGIMSSTQILDHTYANVQNMSFEVTEGIYQISGAILSDNSLYSDMRWVYTGTIESLAFGINGGNYTALNGFVYDILLSDTQMNLIQGFIKVTNAGTLDFQMRTALADEQILLNTNSYITLIKID